MKELFQAKNRISYELTAAARKEQHFYHLLTVVFFLLGAFTFWEFVYELCNIAGAYVSLAPYQALAQFLRMLPLILTAIVYVYINVWCFRAYNAANHKKRVTRWKVHGLITALLGLIIIGYIVYGYISKLYFKVIEGTPSYLYPLDVLLGGVLFIALGSFSVCYGSRLERNRSGLPFGAKTFPVRPFSLYALLAGSCGFAACIYAPFVVDFTHGFIFYNIMFLLMYLTAFAMILVYRFVYSELKPRFRAGAAIKLGTCFLVINLIIIVLYFLALSMQTEGPDQNTFALLPIEYTASVAAFNIIYGANNILAPLCAIVKGVRMKRK